MRWLRIATRRSRRAATISTPSQSSFRACSARSKRCSAKPRRPDMAAGSDDARLQRALLAHLRQEFTAPAAAIIGYAEMLIEDATGLDLREFLPDLERIHTAG